MRKWTEKDNNYIRCNVGKKGWNELAAKFGVSKEAVRRQFYRINLKVPKKKLPVDTKAKKLLEEPKMCVQVRVHTCAPQVVVHNGRRLEYWGKNFEAFKQRLSK